MEIYRYCDYNVPQDAILFVRCTIDEATRSPCIMKILCDVNAKTFTCLQFVAVVILTFSEDKILISGRLHIFEGKTI